MSWDYSGFLGEKVEVGQRLLASDPAFAGSEDLQVRGGASKVATLTSSLHKWCLSIPCHLPWVHFFFAP